METTQQSRKHKDYSAQLKVDGRQYKSISEFCSDYDFSYRTVLNHMKAGRTASEVIIEMRERINNPRKTQVSSKPSYQSIPCTVDGEVFPSQKAACSVFRVPYSSVMARRRRHPEMSFEEALLRGARKWRYILPVEQMHKPVSAQPFASRSGSVCEADLPILNKITGFLTANSYGSQENFYCEWDSSPERWMLEMGIYLRPPKDPQTIRIYYEQKIPNFAKTFQFAIEKLFIIPEAADTERENAALAKCLRMINELHSEYSGVTLSVNSGIICAYGQHITSGAAFSGRQFVFALHNFIGTAAEMYRRLQKEFGGKE